MGPNAVILLTAAGAAAALATGIAAAALVETRAQRRILARVRALAASGDPERHVGRRVALRGVLAGGPIASTWPSPAVASAPDPAVASAPASALELLVDGMRIELSGPIQVVVGSREEAAPDGATWQRRVGSGDHVFVEGRLERAAGGAVASRDAGGYRGRGSRWLLVPDAEEAWPERPLAVYASSRGGRALGLLVMTFAALAVALAHAGLRPAEARGPASTSRGAPAATCGAATDAALAAGDPWRAAEIVKACPDEDRRGLVAWALGDVDEAASHFLEARARGSRMPPTLAHVEAVMLSRPDVARDLVLALRAHRYRGAATRESDVLDCIANRLLSDIHYESPSRFGRLHECVASDARRMIALEEFHFLPAYALNDTTRYHPLRPVFGREMLVPIAGETELGPHDLAQRALFASWTADEDLFRRTLVRLEPSRVRLERLVAREAYGGGGERLALSQAAAVVAAAAWNVGDDGALRRWLPLAEAHARNVLEEEIAMTLGKRLAPDGSHSPSDYGAFEMELFAEAATEAPEAFARRLEELRYTNPARIAAFVGPPGREALRERLGEWAERGLVPPARGAGFLELVRRHHERRLVAHVTKHRDLEEKLAVIGRKLAAAAERPHRYAAVVALESLPSPEP